MNCETCKKEIKTKKYKGNTAPDTCNNCRKITHKRDTCFQIVKDYFIKKNGVILYFCKRIKKYISIKFCKDCKE